MFRNMINASFLPDFQILLIFLSSILTAFLVKLVFKFALKALFKRTKTILDDKIVQFLETPVFWSVILVGGYVFLNQVNLSQNHSEVISNLLKTLAVLIWTLAAIKISATLIVGLGNRQNKDEKFTDIIPIFKATSKILILAAAITVILKLWMIDVTPILASAGVLGIAVAFAAKDTVANLFGGISVFFDKPYGPGDYVIIDEKYRGEVIEIGIRSTKIRTRDDVFLTVPNSVMITKAVINETGLDGKLRVRIPIGIAQGTDLQRAEKIIVKNLKSHPEVLKSPVPRIRYRKFGEFTIDLEALLVISNPADRGRITHELIKQLDKGLRKANIKMPLPQMVIHLDEKSWVLPHQPVRGKFSP